MLSFQKIKTKTAQGQEVGNVKKNNKWKMIDWNFEKLVFFETRKRALSRSREKGNKSSGCNNFSIVHAQKHGVKYPKTINKVSKLNGYTLKPFNSILKIKKNNENKNHSRNAIRMLPTLCK